MTSEIRNLEPSEYERRKILVGRHIRKITTQALETAFSVVKRSDAEVAMASGTRPNQP
jgi:hypothetical protein